ncbi:MAG: DUF2752 domain-containing protein [Deltaproteobacteria bacterium]|nr:DUF2752 domain-containing protein [Deltaproteobacteria bacterium]
MNWIRLTNFIIFILFMSVFGIAFSLTPDARGYGTHEQLLLPPCFFKSLFHIHCPACGLTTSFTYFAHGNFLQSLQTHPAGPLLFLIFVFLMLYALVSFFQNRSFWNLFEKSFTKKMAFFVLFLTLFIWVDRVAFHQRVVMAMGLPQKI